MGLTVPFRLKAAATFALGVGAMAACTSAPGVSASPVAPSVCAELAAKSPAGLFLYNRDYQRRDQILGIDADWNAPHSGGIEGYSRATLEQIARLYAEGFLDPSDQQNDAPEAGELLEFMCQHSTALASGYVVGPNRDDYRVTIDAIELPAASLGSETKQEMLALCEYADEIQDEGDLYCWWD